MSWTLVSATCKLKRFIHKEVAEMRPRVPQGKGLRSTQMEPDQHPAAIFQEFALNRWDLLYSNHSQFSYIYGRGTLCGLSVLGLGAQAAEGQQSVTERGRMRRLCKGSRDDSSEVPVALQQCHLPLPVL